MTNDIAAQMQMELQRVLMEKELSLEQFERLEQMLRGAKDFLIGATPKEYVVGGGLKRPDGEELAAVIQRERFKALGFTPEQVERLHNNPVRKMQHERQVAALQRAAAAFGVTDDEDADDEPEVEEIPVRPVDPLRDREVWMPIGFVDKLIFVLGGSEGDVADHLIDIVNDIRTRHDTVELDAIIPIDLGLVTLIAAGLSDPSVRAAHPEAVELAQQVSKFVMKATEENEFRNDAVPQSAPLHKEAVNGS